MQFFLLWSRVLCCHWELPSMWDLQKHIPSGHYTLCAYMHLAAYTVSTHDIIRYNFAKCWPMFKILAPLDSARHLQ